MSSFSIAQVSYDTQIKIILRDRELWSIFHRNLERGRL
jgi:hypothetical protein